MNQTAKHWTLCLSQNIFSRTLDFDTPSVQGAMVGLNGCTYPNHHNTKHTKHKMHSSSSFFSSLFLPLSLSAVLLEETEHPVGIVDVPDCRETRCECTPSICSTFSSFILHSTSFSFSSFPSPPFCVGDGGDQLLSKELSPPLLLFASFSLAMAQ